MLKTILLATCLLAAPLAARAAEHFHADLKGSAEVPPTGSAGTGTAEATFDPATKKLDYTVTGSGLSGPATMAHFHGPAPAGANAGVLVPLAVTPTMPVTGSATLTDSQVASLEAGNWYVNVHTAAHPGGEIRGQVEKAP